MDAFESIISTILMRQGYWVHNSFKVDLTKEDKHKINRPSSPRWELDIVAYRPADNLLKIVECKSYLDSLGVSFKSFNSGEKTRYKLFNEEITRNVVFERLEEQLLELKAILPKPNKILCLAAGNIVEKGRGELENLFKENKWELFDPAWIKKELTSIANDGYSNTVVSMTAKLLKELI